MVDRIAGVMEPWVTQLKRRVKRNEKFGSGAQDGETIPLFREALSGDDAVHQ